MSSSQKIGVVIFFTSVFCDRVLRAEANTLFCGRSGLAFQYCIESANVNSTVRSLDQGKETSPETMDLLRVIGVGNVGSDGKKATYTLYQPQTGEVNFQSVDH